MGRMLPEKKRNLIPSTSLMFILAALIGLVTGCCAWLLKHMVAALSSFLTAGFSGQGLQPLLLILPVAGLVLTGILCRYVFHRNLSHGVRTLMENLATHHYDMKPWHILTPMLASTVTLGFGGSAGSEGPIACTGAAMGSNVGRWFGLTSKQVMIMIGCGAGAGISGIFKAPIGGALFTIEVLRVPLGTVPVLMLLVSSIVSGLTAYILSGYTPDIIANFEFPQVDSAVIIPAVLIGLFCGVYSIYYCEVMKRIELLLNRIRNKWILNLTGGAILALTVFLFPALYGEGYGVITHVFNGDFDSVSDFGLFTDAGTASLVVTCCAVLALKCVSTSVTNSGGGVSGDFAPTLFAGCIAGLLFFMVANPYISPSVTPNVCVLLGMAAVMAGAIRAPLMAIVLTVEMTSASSQFLPVTIAATVSFGIVRLRTADGFYSRCINRWNGFIRRHI